MAAASCSDGGEPTFEERLRQAFDGIRAGNVESLLIDYRSEHEAAPSEWAPLYLQSFATLYSGHDEAAAQAQTLFRDALDLAERASDALGVAECSLMLGRLAVAPDDQLAWMERAAEHALDAGPVGHSTFNSATFQASTIDRSLGRFADQIDRLQHIQSKLTAGDLNFEFAVQYELSSAERMIGDFESSLESAHLALDLAKQMEDSSSEAITLQLLGFLQFEFEPRDSVGFFERSITAALAAERPDLANHSTMAIGMSAYFEKNYSQAVEVFSSTLDDSLRYGEAHPDMHVPAISNLLYLGDAQQAAGDFSSAGENYNQARELTDRWTQTDYSWKISAGLATNSLIQRDFQTAAQEASRSIGEIEAMRALLPDDGQRVYFLRARQNVYTTLALAQHELDPTDASKPFETMQRVHGRTLREALRGQFDAGNAPPNATLRSTQNLLDDGELLVEYLLGEKGSLLVAVTKRGAETHILPPRDEIESMVQSYRSAILRPQFSIEARTDPEADFRRNGNSGWLLSEILLGPIQSLVKTSSRLVVIPDKQLHRLPFGTLPNSDRSAERLRFLADQLNVDYLPSASLLNDTRKERPSKVIVGIADGGNKQLGLSTLTAAGEELQAITEAYGDDQVMTLARDNFSVPSLREQLKSSPGVLHLIGHVVFDSSHGPRFVLPAVAGGVEYLGTEEIGLLSPTPQLALLSACETAEGELVGGEGILGLVRAFQLSGSREVIASLWQIDDEHSAKLMGDLHRRLSAGAPAREALAEAAKAQRSERFIHPFYWGAFVLYGAG